MDIHYLRWTGPDLCPQDACARRLAAKLPFVLHLTDDVKIGDCLEFSDYFINYPVIRYAGPNDAINPSRFARIAVVCAEPPDEVDEYEQMRDNALEQYKRQLTAGAAA